MKAENREFVIRLKNLEQANLLARCISDSCSEDREFMKSKNQKVKKFFYISIQ